MSQRPNLQEFSAIAGTILDGLLEQHPLRADITQEAAMKLLKVSDPTQMLDSGRNFRTVFGATVHWLTEEGFIDAAGGIPGERCRLTTKSLAVLNAMPANLGGKTIGDSLAEAREIPDSGEARSRTATILGDFIGSAAGSFAKSVGSGG